MRLLHRTSRRIRSWAPAVAAALLVVGSLGLLPAFDSGTPDKHAWSKCGLALCSCLKPADVVPECPLCPEYTGPEQTASVTMNYNASLQIPMTMLMGSLGLIVVLGVRKDEEPTDPEHAGSRRSEQTSPASRHLACATPPPRG